MYPVQTLGVGTDTQDQWGERPSPGGVDFRPPPLRAKARVEGLPLPDWHLRTFSEPSQGLPSRISPASSLGRGREGTMRRLAVGAGVDVVPGVAPHRTRCSCPVTTLATSVAIECRQVARRQQAWHHLSGLILVDAPPVDALNGAER